jgi:hypothetical protein
MPGPSYLAFKSRLMLSSGLLVALLAALTIWKVCAGIEADRELASTQTRSFADAMSAHVGSQLRVIDLSLARSSAALSDLDMSTVRSPETIAHVSATLASASDASFWINFVAPMAKASRRRMGRRSLAWRMKTESILRSTFATAMRDCMWALRRWGGYPGGVFFS